MEKDTKNCVFWDKSNLFSVCKSENSIFVSAAIRTEIISVSELSANVATWSIL